MKATRVLWSGVLAAGVFAAVPAAVKAAPGVGITVVLNGGGHDHVGYGRDMRGAFRYGFERGRSEGAERGYRDDRRGRGGDFRRDSWYRDGDRGYRGGMGSRSEYAAGYRQGFAAAYRSACLSARSGGHGEARYGHDRRDGDRYGSDPRYDRDDERYRDDWRHDGQDWRR
jgi:hypothetical protein